MKHVSAFTPVKCFFAASLIITADLVHGEGADLSASPPPVTLNTEDFHVKGLHLGMSREAFQSALEDFRDNHRETLRQFFIMYGLEAAADPTQSDDKVKREIALLCPITYDDSQNRVELGCVVSKPFYNKSLMVVGRVTDNLIDAIVIKSTFFAKPLADEDINGSTLSIMGDADLFSKFFPVTFAWEKLASESSAKPSMDQAYCVHGGPENILECTNRDIGLNLVMNKIEFKMAKTLAN